MRGVGRRVQYVSCFASASVVCDGGSSAVEDAMRHRRIAFRRHHRGVWYGSCVWNVRASSLQSPASPGARGKRLQKGPRPSSFLFYTLLLSFHLCCLPACSLGRRTPTNLTNWTANARSASATSLLSLFLTALSLLTFLSFDDFLLFITSNLWVHFSSLWV